MVSGESGALTRLCQTCIEHRATSAKLLKVNVPSHCALLAPQAEAFHDTFAQVEMPPPRITYVSANSARVLYDADQISHDLTFNMRIRYAGGKPSRCSENVVSGSPSR
ncbi:hypothetical protein P4S72_07445 [Vibrio sp. PP-XX7]